MIKKTCLLCSGSGERVDANTKQLRLCSLCKGKGYVRMESNAKRQVNRTIKTAAETVDKVLNAICEYQKEYLDTHDVMKLKPMRLDDIAKIVGIDNTTVHKCIQGKFIGVVSVKKLFSTSVSGMSNKSIMHMLSELLKSNPWYNDHDCVRVLQDQNITIARRTVAKYRKELQIPKVTKR